VDRCTSTSTGRGARTANGKHLTTRVCPLEGSRPYKLYVVQKASPASEKLDREAFNEFMDELFTRTQQGFICESVSPSAFLIWHSASNPKEVLVATTNRKNVLLSNRS